MQHSHVKSLTQGLERKLILATTLFTLAMPLFAQEKGPAFFGIGGTIVGKPNGRPNFPTAPSAPSAPTVPTKPSAPSFPSAPSMPSAPTMPNNPAPISEHEGDYGRGGYGNYGHGGHGGYGRPGHGGNRYSYTEYLQTFINRTFVGEKVIPVKQLLNLGYNKYGKAIYQVKIEAKSMFGFGTAQLLINGQPESMPERLSPMLSEKTFEISGYANRNDIEIKKLQILLRGQIYLSKLGVLIQK